MPDFILGLIVILGMAIVVILAKVNYMSDEERAKYGIGPRGQGGGDIETGEQVQSEPVSLQISNE